MLIVILMTPLYITWGYAVWVRKDCWNFINGTCLQEWKHVNSVFTSIVCVKNSAGTSKVVLQYIHSDVWRPASVLFKGGAIYFVIFIDDFFSKCMSLFYEAKIWSFYQVQVMKSRSWKTNRKTNQISKDR